MRCFSKEELREVYGKERAIMAQISNICTTDNPAEIDEIHIRLIQHIDAIHTLARRRCNNSINKENKHEE